MDARTNYKPITAPLARRRSAAAVERELARRRPDPSALRSSHIADLSSLLGRVSLEIGATAPEVLAMPTDARLKRYAEGQTDPELE